MELCIKDIKDDLNNPLSLMAYAYMHIKCPAKTINWLVHLFLCDAHRCGPTFGRGVVGVCAEEILCKGTIVAVTMSSSLGKHKKCTQPLTLKFMVAYLISPWLAPSFSLFWYPLGSPLVNLLEEVGISRTEWGGWKWWRLAGICSHLISCIPPSQTGNKRELTVHHLAIL